MRKIRTLAILLAMLLITVGAPTMGYGMADGLNVTIAPDATVAAPRPVPGECAGLASIQLELCRTAVTTLPTQYDYQDASVEVPGGPVLVMECREQYDSMELTDCLAEIASNAPRETE